MAEKVIIIGGGVAGLSAGVALVKKGLQVELFEARPFLGGRCYSFAEPATGNIVDNGQHLMAGFYYDTFKLLEIIGTKRLVGLQKRLEIDFFEKGGRHFDFICPPLPMPFSFLTGLLRYRKFPKGDVFRLLTKALKIRKEPQADMTAEEWLDDLGISSDAVYAFFRPLILATLNADIGSVSAVVFQTMLKTIMSAAKKDAVLAFPEAGLSDIIAEPAGKYIMKNGGDIKFSTEIKELLVSGSAVKSVVDMNGHEHTADFYIAAVPPHDLCAIIPEGENHYLKEWNYSPIIGVNLWYDRPVMKDKMIGLLDSPFHWCFDKGGSAEKGYRISLIISAADDQADMSKDDLLKISAQEIEAYLPESKSAKLLYSQVIKEKKATVLITPESLALREKTTSPWPNLFIAGDWTDTGLPATIESAVKSGFTAAGYVV